MDKITDEMNQIVVYPILSAYFTCHLYPEMTKEGFNKARYRRAGLREGGTNLGEQMDM